MTPSASASRLLVCAFLTGGGLMAHEVVWFRFLSMFAVSSTLAVSLMLAVVYRCDRDGRASGFQLAETASWCCGLPAHSDPHCGMRVSGVV